MSRLSEYINSVGSSGGSSTGNEYVQLSGFIENQEMFAHLMTSDPGFDLSVRNNIRKVLREARKNLSKDAASYIKNDPRKAARAIKHIVYKQMFGGNVSILQKRTSGAKCEIVRQKKLQPGQRGGNRRLRVDDSRNRLDKYYGADRGFILRFINSGTVPRMTRYGNRGAIRQTDWFGHTAPWQMEAAGKKLADAINEYIRKKTNG